MPTKQTVPIRVICVDPPVYAHQPDYLFGIQDKDKNVILGTEISADELRFELVLDVKQHTDGTPNFTGAYAHGSLAERFLYLTVKQHDPTGRIIQRIKIPLQTITWEQIEQTIADDSKSLQVSVGGEKTGTVPLLDDGWVTVSQSDLTR
jgi:hypothetical protein